MLVIHVYVNTGDAIGANIINTMVESLAPSVEKLTNGKMYLRILSNYADRCLARARCVIPTDILESKSLIGEEIRDAVIHDYQFTTYNTSSAYTHNKGIIIRIEPLEIATENK